MPVPDDLEDREHRLSRLVGYLVEHDCRTVVECGWSGRKNGELLLLADPLFDVLLTLDKKPALPAESGHKPNCRSDRSGAVEPDSGPLSDRTSVPRSARDHRASSGRPPWFVAVALANASVDSNR